MRLVIIAQRLMTTHHHSMRILLLSAYDTDSHRAWCQGLITHCSDFQWTYLSLPGRHFSWRIRGNPLSWAFGETRSILENDYDLILATSMVDLATLKGIVPKLASTPSVLYMHENQFAYPKSTQQFKSVEPQMVNLYSALAADQVIFNSQYNLKSMLDGATELLKKMPDLAPISAIEALAHRSSVLPVPIHPPKHQSTPFNKGETLKVIWNHRWEYDKGPDVLARLVSLAHQQNSNLSFTVAGNRFRSIPASFQSLMDNKPPCLKHIGTFAQRRDYETELANHHVVLSTAHHEFQGLAMLEGVAHGCTPLAPNALAYPEWIPNDCLYPTYSDCDTQAKTILTKLIEWQRSGLSSRPDTSQYYWSNLAPIYTQTLLKIREDYSV